MRLEYLVIPESKEALKKRRVKGHRSQPVKVPNNQS